MCIYGIVKELRVIFYKMSKGRLTLYCGNFAIIFTVILTGQSIFLVLNRVDDKSFKGSPIYKSKKISMKIKMNFILISKQTQLIEPKKKITFALFSRLCNLIFCRVTSVLSLPRWQIYILSAT